MQHKPESACAFAKRETPSTEVTRGDLATSYPVAEKPVALLYRMPVSFPDGLNSGKSGSVPILKDWYIVHRAGKRFPVAAQAFKEFDLSESGNIINIQQPKTGNKKKQSSCFIKIPQAKVDA